MASSPFFSLSAFPPSSLPPPSSASGHSAYYTAQDTFSSAQSTYSPAHSAISASPEDHFRPGPPSGGPSNTSFGTVASSRPYPLVERRSFRDASVAADVMVTRDELAQSFGSNGGAGAIGEGRKPSTGSVGAIGDGRRVTPSPTPGLRREEDALGIPAGIFDAHGALTSPARDDSRAPSENGGRSRPSSFILDVLPQTRERDSAGPSTPSLSLESTSQPPSTSSADFQQPLPSPHSLAPIAPPAFLSQGPSSNASATSLPLSPGGGVLSASRTSSPGPLDSSHSSVPSVESLATKVNALESTVSDLSSLLATEFRSLREEVGLLRSLVIQQQQQSSSAGAARQAFERAAERETDSPVLTLRSPSPKHAAAFPQPIPLGRQNFPNGSATSLLGQPATSPAPISPHSAPGSSAGGFFGLAQQQQQQGQDTERLRSTSDESASASSSLKDEQIKLLTAQVTSLTTTVSHLLANPGSAASNPAVAAAAAAAAGMAPGGASGAASPLLNGPSGPAGPASAPMAARNLSLPLASPSFGMGGGGMGGGMPTGLGVTTPGGMLSPALGGPGPARTPMMRQMSTGGVARSASMRSASGGAASFDTLPSNSAWDGGMSSPMLGGPPSAVSSPMLGNPPGSLGAKWEMLGVGTDLFRAMAKYGLGPPTKIQGKAIPCVVRGQDVVAQAPAIQERIQCYVIPALQIIFTHASLAAQQAALEGTAPPPRGVQAVVVTATVDQAAQAQRLAVGLGGSLGIRTSLCVGSSSDLQNELQTLLKAPPHILVGTPQKLVDLFALRQLPMGDIRLLVVDECDQLIARNLSDLVLNLARLFPATTAVPTPAASSPVMARSPLPGAFDSPGFAPMARFGSNSGGPNGGNGGAGAAAGAPVSTSTVERQMAVFSCTVPQDVLTFASSLQLKEPVKVLVRRENGDGASPSFRGLKQFYLYLAMGGNSGSKSKAVGAGRREAGPAREWKLEALADLIEDSNVDHAVVFASSVEGVEAVTYKLGTRAIEALALHQDIGQQARQQIVAKFRATGPNRPGLSNKRVLVVYDALSRSLSDVHPVPLVINFDMPRAVEDYISRISCATTTGYNKGSQVINIVTPNEVDMVRAIESFYRCKIQELPNNFVSMS
ncbi:hypothetical protein JCM10207_006688 [Rhodosporidiobolus poonsookiae]